MMKHNIHLILFSMLLFLQCSTTSNPDPDPPLPNPVEEKLKVTIDPAENSVLPPSDKLTYPLSVAITSKMPLLGVSIDVQVSSPEYLKSVVFQKCYGGSGTEQLRKVIGTKDGGSLIVGTTDLNGGDVSGLKGSLDIWVVKTNPNGILDWQKCIGGTAGDIGRAGIQTLDGGYAIVGHSLSNNGDISGNRGGGDLVVIKLSSTGSILWQKCYGGTSFDEGRTILELPNGDLIVGGQTDSKDLDVSINKGSSDFWLLRLNSDGALKWEKTFGGSMPDIFTKVILTTDGGYALIGQTASNDKDVSGNKGEYDAWITKIDGSGVIKWQYCLGGLKTDTPEDIIQNQNGDFIVVGQTVSSDGDFSSVRGGSDAWITSFNGTNGKIISSRIFTGSNDDALTSICIDANGNLLLGGITQSINGDMVSNAGLGSSDCWLVKVDKQFSSIWSRFWGGSDWDGIISMEKIAGSFYLVGGQTLSNNGDILGNRGRRDFLQFKIEEGPQGVFYTNSWSTKNSTSDFNIAGTPAGVQCSTTVKVVSLSTASNTWTGSYKYSRK
jgi:hypothetical protein